jgi:hypothetical protein
MVLFPFASTPHRFDTALPPHPGGPGVTDPRVAELKALQAMLGVPETGRLDGATRLAVRQLLESFGLGTDGLSGPGLDATGEGLDLEQLLALAQHARGGRGHRSAATPGAGSGVSAPSHGAPAAAGSVPLHQLYNPTQARRPSERAPAATPRPATPAARGTAETPVVAGGRSGAGTVLSQGASSAVLPGGRSVAAVGCFAVSMINAHNSMLGGQLDAGQGTIDRMARGGGFSGNLIVDGAAARSLGMKVVNSANSGAALAAHVRSGGRGIISVVSNATGRDRGHWMMVNGVRPDGTLEIWDSAGGKIRTGRVVGRKIEVEGYRSGNQDMFGLSPR